MTPATSPYAHALLDYWRGMHDAAYTIHRDDGFSHTVPVAESFAGEPFGALEELALARAVGEVLDVGAGVGRHALFLQGLGHQVTAFEIEPELVAIMTERGVAKPLAGNIFFLSGRKFDTILMLMNGFGLVGTLSGADTLFQRAPHFLSPSGQILCDSLDVRRTANPTHLAYQKANLDRGLPAGQMRFSIEYQGCRGDAFDWLHLDFTALRDISGRHGLSAELLAQEESGRYLARLTYGDTAST